MTLTDVVGKEHSLTQDLHFQQARYESKHQIVCRETVATVPIRHFRLTYHQVFKNPKGALIEKLRASGPIPPSLDNADTSTPNGVKKRPGGAEDSAKRRKKIDRSIDMDRLADNMQKLNEDDLLYVVQLLHDNKNDEMYMKNDVERELNLSLTNVSENCFGAAN